MQAHRVTREHMGSARQLIDPATRPPPSMDNDEESLSMIRRFAGGISRIAFAVFGTVTPPSSQEALPEEYPTQPEANRSMKTDPDEADAAATRALQGPSRSPTRPTTPQSPAPPLLFTNTRDRSERSPRSSSRVNPFSSPTSGFKRQLMPTPLVSPMASRDTNSTRGFRNSLTVDWARAQADREDSPSPARPKAGRLATPPCSPNPLARRRLKRSSAIPLIDVEPLGPSSAGPSTRTRTRQPASLRRPSKTPKMPSLVKYAEISTTQARRAGTKRPRVSDTNTPRTSKRVCLRSSSVSSHSAAQDHEFAPRTSSLSSPAKRTRGADNDRVESSISRARPPKKGTTAAGTWDSDDEDEPSSNSNIPRTSAVDPSSAVSPETSISARVSVKKVRFLRDRTPLKRRRLDTPTEQVTPLRTDDAAEEVEVAGALSSISSSVIEDSPVDPSKCTNPRHVDGLGCGRSSAHSARVRRPVTRKTTALPSSNAMASRLRPSSAASRVFYGSAAKSGVELATRHLGGNWNDYGRVYDSSMGGLVATIDDEPSMSSLRGSGHAVQAALLAASLEGPSLDKR